MGTENPGIASPPSDTIAKLSLPTRDVPKFLSLKVTVPLSSQLVLTGIFHRSVSVNCLSGWVPLYGELFRIVGAGLKSLARAFVGPEFLTILIFTGFEQLSMQSFLFSGGGRVGRSAVCAKTVLAINDKSVKTAT